MNRKRCTRCHRTKNLDKFGIDNRRNIPKAICKKCDAEIHLLRMPVLTEEERQAKRIRDSVNAKARWQRRRESGLCGFCDKPAVSGASQCEEHLAKSLERERKRRITLLRRTICTRCGQRPPIAGRRRCEECSRPKEGILPRYDNRTYASRREYLRNQRVMVKDECFKAYGGYRCVCCGEQEPKFLSIDHVANDGAEHRKTMFTNHYYGSIYAWLRRNDYPAGFQVLCMNCNFGKRMNGGICPHQQKDEHPIDSALSRFTGEGVVH